MWKKNQHLLICWPCLHILASFQYTHWRTSRGSHLSSCTSKTIFSCTCPLLSRRPCTAIMWCHQNLGFLDCGKSVVEEGFQICLLKILVCLPSRLGQGKQDIWLLDIGGGTFQLGCIISFARMQCTHFVAPEFVMGSLHFFQQLLTQSSLQQTQCHPVWETRYYHADTYRYCYMPRI